MTTQSELLRIMRLREKESENPTEREVMRQAADEIEKLQKQIDRYVETSLLIFDNDVEV